MGKQASAPLSAKTDSGAGAPESLIISDVTVDERGQLAFGECADLLCSNDAVLEQNQGWDAADAEFGRHGLVGVHIHLGYEQLAIVFLGHFFQNRGDRLART